MTETHRATMDAIRHEVSKLDGLELVALLLLRTLAPRYVEIASDLTLYQLYVMMATQQTMMDEARHEMLKLGGLDLGALLRRKTLA